MRTTLIFVGLLAACEPEIPQQSTDIPTGDLPGDTGGTDDTGDTDVELGPVGVLVVGHWPEERLYSSSTWVHGVFSSDVQWAEPVDPIGYVNFVDDEVWLSWQGWMLPDIGGEVAGFDERPDWEPDTLETLDAGERVLVGEDLEAYRLAPDGGAALYLSDPDDQVPDDIFDNGGPLDLWIEGGADISQQLVSGAITLPEPLSIDGVNPLELQVIRSDQDVELEWTPSTDDTATVLVTASGEIYTTAWRVDDVQGGFDISAGDIQDLGGESAVITVARMIETQVELAEGTLLVRALHETWSYWVQVEGLAFSPANVFTGETSVLEVTREAGSFDVEDLVIDMGEGIFIEDVAVEGDGRVARVTVIVDEDAPSVRRDVSVTSGGETLTAPITLGVYHPLEGGDTCPMAGVGPAIRTGFHHDSRAGRTDGNLTMEGCQEGVEYPGVDSFHRLSMLAGETVEISAILPNGDVAVGIYDACEGVQIACLDDADALNVEVMNYTADEDGDVYIVFDSAYTDESELWAVVDIIPAVDLYVRGEVVQGGSATLTIENRSWDYVQGDVVFDFGSGITVTDVRVAGGTGPDAEVDVTAALDATLGDRVVSATQGSDSGVSRFNGLRVAGQLAPSDDCADADVLGDVAQGLYFGTTLGHTDLGNPTTACGPTTMPGTDAVYRVDIPAAGSGLAASVTSQTDASVYLVRDCGATTRPIACADVAAGGDTEFLNWTAGAGESGAWYLVVDARDGGEEGSGDFRLDLYID
jgi:hypothetical protein